MQNVNNPKLQSLVGSSVSAIAVDTAHGEILSLKFSNGKTLTVCTYDPSDVRQGKYHADELYVGIDGDEI